MVTIFTIKCIEASFQITHVLQTLPLLLILLIERFFSRLCNIVPKKTRLTKALYQSKFTLNVRTTQQAHKFNSRLIIIKGCGSNLFWLKSRQYDTTLPCL